MVDDDFVKQAFRASAGRRSARFAGRATNKGGGMIFVVAGLEDKGLLFGKNGFVGAGLQTDLLAANRRLAAELQELTADKMQASLVRPNVSSGRLYNSLMAPMNRFADQFGFGVGNPEWLDRSPAKYWRQIDQGFEGHLGRVIYGVWGDTLTGMWKTSPTNKAPGYPIAGAQFSSFGEGAGQRLRPMGPKSAFKFLRDTNPGMRPKTKPGVKGVINEPIHPHEYFERAWKDFNIKGRYMQTVREIITRSFGGAGIPTRANLEFMAGRGPQPSPSKAFRR